MQQPGVVPAGLGPCAGAPLPAGLSPHAAAALQFWLSQGALNPHVHASYLYSLQGPCGEPLGHHFSGDLFHQLLPHCQRLDILMMYTLCNSDSTSGRLFIVALAMSYILVH